MEQRSYITEEIGLAALAHDLRAPMCVAAGAAQLALEAGGADVSVQLRQILQAMGAMDRMLAMMGEGQTKDCPFTKQMLHAELTAMTQERAAQKAQTLSIDLGAMGGMVYEADYGALCRLLTNLLSNAIKYTQPGGEITLRAQMEQGWRSRQQRIRFIVADNGPGMTRAFMHRMFQPFARARVTAQEQGKGLGLAIAREMVRRMEGTIRVRSERGRGTTFTVSVPVSTGRVN